MPKFGPSLAIRLAAVLLALHLAVGPTLCRARDAGPGPGKEATVLGSPSPEAEGGAPEEHDQADAGDHDCPETFLVPEVAGPLPGAMHARLLASRPDVQASPAYDVPPPVPIA